MFKKHQNSNKAFTLIELLVVVAIIGILSGVVIASLNSARDKGKIAFVKSTLKNMQSQAEITYNETGSYASLFDGSLNCAGALSNMAQSLIDRGFMVKCNSLNAPSFNDVHLRFGATAILYDTNSFKAWSTDQNGVVTWDQKGVDSTGAYVDTDTYVNMNFSTSNTACAKAGGRLPSIEQLSTLAKAYYSASGGTYKPTSPGFVAHDYWSSTLVPSSVNNSLVYYVYFGSGGTGTNSITNPIYVRCVR